MKTVQQTISAMWVGRIEQDIMEIPANSCVGKAVVELCEKAQALLGVRPEDVDVPDGSCALESDVEQRIVDAVIDQANVWYFG